MENQCSCIVMLCTLWEGKEVATLANPQCFNSNLTLIYCSKLAIAIGPGFRETQKNMMILLSHKSLLRLLETMSLGSWQYQ